MEEYPSGMQKIIRIADRINECCGKIFAWLVIPLVGGVTYEVIARSFFNAPTVWAYDITYMLFGTHYMLGAGYTLLKKEHIRMDMIYERLTTRRKGIIDATLYLFFFFPGMIFYFIAGWEAAQHSWSIREASDLTPWRPPIYPFKSVVPVAAALLTLQGISEFLKSAHAALKGRQP